MSTDTTGSNINKTAQTVERRPVVPAASNDTMILTAFLVDRGSSGELVSYKSLSAAISRDVTRDAAGIMRTALRRALRDHGLVFETVRCEGFRRVVGGELVSSQRCGIDRIRREARRRNEKLSKLNLSELDNDGKVSAAALASAYGAVGMMATTKSVKKIEGAVRTADAAQLPIARTLALFQ